MHRMTRRQHAVRTFARWRTRVRAVRSSDSFLGTWWRWVIRQGPMSLFLTVAGMVAFTVAAFSLAGPLGWATIGVCCWLLEWETRTD